MTVLLLIRHGQTDTAGKRLTGWERGIHLNDRGREQAAALIGRLEGVPIRAIYSSPLERCRETAAPVARARRVSIRVRRALIETGYGDWTGRSISQLRRTKTWRQLHVSPSSVRFPNGESLAGVQERAIAELGRIAEDHPNGVVAIITHADVVALAVAHFAGAHVDQFQRLVIEPASISVVAIGGGVPRVLKVNDTGDLGALVRRRSRTKLRG